MGGRFRANATARKCVSSPRICWTKWPPHFNKLTGAAPTKLNKSSGKAAQNKPEPEADVDPNMPELEVPVKVTRGKATKAGKADTSRTSATKGISSSPSSKRVTVKPKGKKSEAEPEKKPARKPKGKKVTEPTTRALRSSARLSSKSKTGSVH